ncbi:MAG: amidohydrolase family protein [Halieaceae bacterium]
MRKFLKQLFKALLLLSLALFALAWLGISRPVPLPAAVSRADSLLISNAQLVDLESGLIAADTQVMVRDGIITAVGPRLDQNTAAQQLDAGGAYLIPGLFDMHVHSLKLSPVLHHPLYIAAGVTAVRDMGGCLGAEDPWLACVDDKRAWNLAADAAAKVTPRYDVVTSLPVDGGAEIPAGFNPALGAADADGARQRAAFDRARGLDFIKPYSSLSRESYLALAQAASANGLYLAGHKPLAVSGLEAVAAGQRSIEHAFLFIWECFPAIDELRQRSSVRAIYNNDMRQRMIAEHSDSLCQSLHAAMASKGTALVPTHTTRKLDAYASDSEFRSDPRLRYIPAPLQQLWLGDADGMSARAGPGGQESYREFYRFGIRQTGIAHAAGVTILAGTDAPDSFVFPGSSLHDELDHLVAAGLSPLEALRAATVEPARFLGLEGKAGSIQVGARADMVLLQENPLDDIRAVRSIESVVLAGAVYDRAALDELLAEVETTAGRWDMWPKFLWQALNSPIMRRQFAD